MSAITFVSGGGGGGSGTVTSISAGNSQITLSPDPITSTGTISLTETSLTTTDGTVYWDGTLLNTTAVGTSGWVLTSQGAGMPPIYAAVAGDFADSFPTDSGTATPSSGVLNIDGDGKNITTTGSGNTVTVGLTGLTQYDVLVGGASNAISSVSPSTSGYILTSNGTSANPTFKVPAASSISITGDSGGALTGDAFIFTGGSTGLTFAGATATETLEGTLVVANGGSGAVTLTGVLTGNGTSPFTASAITQYDVLVGGASNAISSISPSTANYVLTSNGTSSNPSFKVLPSSSISITGDSGGALTGDAFTFTGGSTGLTFSGATSTETLTGTLVVSNGGTGAATLTGVLIGNGTSAVTGNAITQYDVLVGGASNAISSVSPSTSGYILTSTGTGSNPSFQAPAASSISLTGDSGGALTGNAFTIKTGVASFNCGSTVTLVGSGSTLELSLSDGNSNTMIGSLAGNGTFAGATNTALGVETLSSLTTSAGEQNTAIGYRALNADTTGAQNTAFGYDSLYQITTGSFNTCIGNGTGDALTGGDSSNIFIGTNTTGTSGDNNVLRIGSVTGSGPAQINKAFISGINGITVTGTAVLVSSSDQLGVATSSARFKDNIQDMADQSSAITKLRPVTFQYKSDKDNLKQFGLIAEEVNNILPELVLLDKENLPFTVKYHDLPVLLLNELQKALKRIDALEEFLQDHLLSGEK